ncbi:MAG: AsmA-like C-terminal domain-containing protein [Deltaproteobacteria bacterium]|nr:AsmA-like C-terminal domain-containing protein [Deltaproteobacteria bacterium]
MSDGSDKPSPIPSPMTNIQFEIPQGLRTWFGKTDGLTIRVEEGLLDLTTRENQSFRFSDINLSVEHTKGVLTLQINCTSNFFQKLDLKGQMELASSKTNGTLTLSGLKTGELTGNSQDSKTLRLEDGVMDLQTNFEGTGVKSLKAHINLSAPSLALSRGQRKITVKGARIRGNMQVKNAYLVVSLSDMTLDYPPMHLSGVFRNQKDTPMVSLHLEGKDVDVPAVRSCALGLVGDISAVQNVFDIVKGGKVPSISVDTKGKSLADLSNLNAYTIKGIMRDGRISLPDPKLDVKDVAGSALISKGTLFGKRLYVKLNKINGTGGILNVSLTDKARPFNLDIQVDADLQEAHRVLKRIVPKGTFAQQLERIQWVEGQATARLKLDKTEEVLGVDVDCSSCRLKAAYELLPLPVTLTEGKIHYRQHHVQLNDAAGTLGGSRFFVSSGGLDWGDEPRIEIAASKATVLLEELHPFIRDMDALKRWLKNPESLKGRIFFHALNLKGPLKNPAAWHYQADLEMEKVFLNTSFLPGPIKVPNARMQVTPEAIRLSAAEIDILDSHFNMTGTVAGPRKGINHCETNISGTFGAQSIDYLYDTLKLPDDFRLQAPLKVRSGHIIWAKDNGVSLEGQLLFPKGPGVSVNVSQGPGKLNIRKLALEDGAARASFGLLAHEELVDVSFSGKIEKSTLDGMFLKNPFLGGWIEGDISARILPMQSYSTSAEGFLRGNDILIYGIPLPAKIVDFSLHAEGQQLLFDSVRMLLNQNRLFMSGSADLATEDPRFDVDISTDNVDLDKVLELLNKSKGKTANEDGKEPWHFPIRGTAHLMWNSLKVGGFTWHPFQGEVSINPESIRISVENAALCGISSPGYLKLNKDNIDLDFRLKAEKAALSQSITCLTQKRIDAEGTFDLEAKITAEGKWDDLPGKLEGPILFSASDGRIKHGPTLARVLSVLNVTDIFKGKLPSLENEGLPYDLVQISGNLKNGKIQMQKGLMKSSALNLVFNGDIDLLNRQLDIKMLASPFTLTDRLIKLIPVAGYILGGTLISIPVRIDGSLKDPKVKILPFSEIASGVWGMLKRTLETPVRIVEPMMGEGDRTKNKEDESFFW